MLLKKMCKQMCLMCGKPVNNTVFTYCDTCWDFKQYGVYWNHHSDIIKNLNDSLSLYEQTIEDVEMYVSKFIDFNFQIIHHEYESGIKWFILETEEYHYGIELSRALQIIESKKKIIIDDIVAEGFVVRLQNQNVTKFKSFKFINPEFLLKHEE